ncbi:MAG: hypothetical protein HKO66_13140, partial [Saprospiraceae bacterium]|nr:hypothetical protein [Bacteroidia bacterium]NNL93178.1 hypothetical protein [Saprospiraceae bacterium]
MEISKNILLLIFLGFSINGLTNSNPTEMIHYECPDEMACLTSQITINDELYNPELSVVEVANCGSRYNQENYKFEATSHDISFRLTWDVAGEDLKVGLVSGCMPYGNCIGESDCSSSQDITMEFEDLIIGHEYVVYVDACFFYPVDFELEITPGEPGEFSSVTGISTKQCDEQPDVYCNSLPIEIDVFYQDDDQEEYFEQAEGNWNFFVDGPESFDFTIDDIANASFNVTQFGNYVVCLESVALSCGSYEIDYCYELEVIDKSVDFGRLKVCEHELNEDDWVPSIHWDGDPISEPGFHIIETQDICGCDLFQQVEVIKLEEVEEFVEIELCPDDYPYTYFEDFEFEYSQFDIETNLVIHRGSLQEDYRRDECDSLVYLTLVNENPQDRCSSCDLPISLNKSKIVYCIPFDNEAIDVSGKRNIVLPVGIDFDDNGSSENILWDAVFDGDLDYVELPHISDLNTTDFSLDFKFNKDEDFENGPIETLFSKGDSEDNLRYIINVEQVTDQTFNLVARFY